MHNTDTKPMSERNKRVTKHLKAKETVKTAQGVNLRELFPCLEKNPFFSRLKPGPGFSFACGPYSPAETLKRLELIADRKEQAARGPVRRLEFCDAEFGLHVTAEYALYSEHNALMYGVTLESKGNGNIDHLRLPNSYDLEFSLAEMGDPRLHTIGGGSVEYYYPPLAYRLQESRLFGSPGYGDPKGIGTGADGRSSTMFLPFFFLQSEERDCGLFGGIEWSGLWHIDFKQKSLED